MPSKSEQVLQALFALLKAEMPAGAEVVRNVGLPTRVEAGGWVCLRDGDPGEPEVYLSPLTFIYSHIAEVDLVVDLPNPERDALFDQLKVAVGVALARDRTLGGLCDFVIGEAVEPVDIAVEAGAPLKAASVGVVLTYSTADPLG